MHDLTFEALVLRSRAMVHLNLLEKLMGISILLNNGISAAKKRVLITFFTNDFY